MLRLVLQNQPKSCNCYYNNEITLADLDEKHAISDTASKSNQILQIQIKTNKDY